MCSKCWILLEVAQPGRVTVREATKIEMMQFLMEHGMKVMTVRLRGPFLL